MPSYPPETGTASIIRSEHLAMLMMDKTDLFCFSPTGGTAEVGRTFADAMADVVEFVDLCRNGPVSDPGDRIAVFAAPVFAGRLPPVAAERIRTVDGHGRIAISLVVYGTRAYDDALLELNDILAERGFTVIASGAFVAEHSIVRSVGPGRPDGRDSDDIVGFAGKVLAKIGRRDTTVPSVPGNRPYRPDFAASSHPVTSDDCTLCGRCAKVCPVGAITIENDEVVTDEKTCFMCMACVKACLERVRNLPAPVMEAMTAKLGPLASVRRPNETFLRRQGPYPAPASPGPWTHPASRASSRSSGSRGAGSAPPTGSP